MRLSAGVRVECFTKVNVHVAHVQNRAHGRNWVIVPLQIFEGTTVVRADLARASVSAARRALLGQQFGADRMISITASTLLFELSGTRAALFDQTTDRNNLLVVVIAGLNVEPAQRARPRFKLLLQDEAAEVPAFKVYRDALQAVVAARDADRLLPMIHPELRSGWEPIFRITKERLGGQEHQSWTGLEALLRLGGTFTKGPNRVRGYGQRQHATREFCAPYVWSAYPRPLPLPLTSEVDPWVILGTGVAARARPPRDMRVLMRLDYDLVHLFSTADVHAGAPQEWIGIVLPDGRQAFVAQSLIRSPGDYHACFGEFDGVWLMTEFAQRGVIG